ncbi:MAG TPA: response regulator [Bryobacteraceae bacterium]|nr:response regulator [Bryobacteraceae bacterium]
MRSFRDISIQHKLVAINMVTSSVVLSLACATFLAYELVAYRKSVTQQLSTGAQIVAQASTAALAFEDRRSAMETLATLRAEPNVVAGCIYTKDDRPFAAFLRGEARRDLPRHPGPSGARFVDHHLIFFQPIVFDGERIGTVYLKRDLDDIYARLERYAGIVLGVWLLATLAAYLLSSRLQRVISEPTLRLAEMAGRVSAEQNYSLRAVKRGNDEIGVLVDSFNQMMEQIQARTRDLDYAREALERHVVELCDEIASRQRVQDELLAAKQAAEESSRAKSVFLANMSHELRTPLNAIIGYSEMLREDAEEAGQQKPIPDLERISTAGRHLLALINSVLDLSKAEAGKTELLWEDVAVTQIFADAASALAPLARQNRNQLNMHCAPGVRSIHVDAVKFRQSLYNVLSNACKFTRNGTVTVDVLPVSVQRAEYVEWRVSDTGIGIQPEQMRSLFQPFSQGDASTTRKFGGTGLGLAISRRFCELMGGTITATSEPGKGSTFTIRLPLAGQASAVAVSPEPEPVARPSPSGEPRAGSILVVDDDPTVHDLMRRTLAKEGFEVEVASSGEEGLRRAREIHPAAITLDVFMPGMDGWTVLSALKNDPEVAGIPVVLVTIADDRQRGCVLGAAEFLQKPVEPERLVEALRKWQPQRTAGPVLLVDDDGASRDRNARALRQKFGPVMEAADGRAALAALTRQKPGLIVLDLVMPGMDGFDFIATLRLVEEWRKIPVVVLTAQDIGWEDRQRLQGSVNRILRKENFSGVGLAAEIADLLIGSPARTPVPRDCLEIR